MALASSQGELLHHFSDRYILEYEKSYNGSVRSENPKNFVRIFEIHCHANKIENENLFCSRSQKEIELTSHLFFD